MATKIRITGVLGVTGESQRARVYNPDGTTNADIALAESPLASGQFTGEATLTLANALSDPYEVEARKVVTQDAAGFTASTTIRLTRGTLGWVKSNVLLSDRYLDMAISGVTGGGGGGGGTINIGNTSVSSDTSGPAGATTADNLRVQDLLGNPVANAQVEAFIASEYASAPGSATPRGFAVSNDQGRWYDMLLNAGLLYTIIARGPNGITYGPMALQI